MSNIGLFCLSFQYYFVNALYLYMLVLIYCIYQQYKASALKAKQNPHLKLGGDKLFSYQVYALKKPKNRPIPPWLIAKYGEVAKSDAKAVKSLVKGLKLLDASIYAIELPACTTLLPWHN